MRDILIYGSPIIGLLLGAIVGACSDEWHRRREYRRRD